MDGMAWQQADLNGPQPQTHTLATRGASVHQAETQTWKKIIAFTSLWRWCYRTVNASATRESYSGAEAALHEMRACPVAHGQANTAPFHDTAQSQKQYGKHGMVRSSTVKKSSIASSQKDFPISVAFGSLTTLLSIHSIVAKSPGEYLDGIGATLPLLIFIANASWLCALKGRLKYKPSVYVHT